MSSSEVAEHHPPLTVRSSSLVRPAALWGDCVEQGFINYGLRFFFSRSLAFLAVLFLALAICRLVSEGGLRLLRLAARAGGPSMHCIGHQKGFRAYMVRDLGMEPAS